MQALTSDLTVLCALTRQANALVDRLHAVAESLQPDEDLVSALQVLRERTEGLIRAVQHREVARWDAQIDPRRYPPPRTLRPLISSDLPHGKPIDKLPPAAARQ